MGAPSAADRAASGPRQDRCEILVSAGEASGDLHAARLLSELRRQRPDVRAFGLGGDELAAAGLERIADSSEISVVGITEALRVLPRARQIFRALVDAVERRAPSLALLVDFPDFNLRLAKRLAREDLEVVYYISPQLWAWRRRRVRIIRRAVDRMLVLFGFEVDFYREHGIDVVHVGHPLVDEVPDLPSAWEDEPPPDRYRLALLPGSRRSEIEALLPTMLAAARRLGHDEDIEVRVIRAPTVREETVAGIVAEAEVPARVVAEERFAAIADSHLALCASGTATLETALLGTPMVVVYRLHAWSYWLARLLVDLPAFALVNLVLEERAVPELLQAEANPDRIAAEARILLDDAAAREQMRERLSTVRDRLGESGASRRAAREVAKLLPARGQGSGP